MSKITRKYLTSNLADITNTKSQLKRHKDLFDGLAKLRQKHREENFQEWLNTENREGFIVKDILIKMIQEMKTVLTNDGYVIKDEKAFRDYMASYIYRHC